MKLRKPGNKNGHLLFFRNPETPSDNFSVFLSGLEFSQLKMLKAVRDSYSSLLPEVLPGWEMESRSIGDLREVHFEVKDIDRNRITPFGIEDFCDEEGVPISYRIRAVIKRFGKSGELHLPDLRTGSVASGPDFFNREDEIADVWRAVKEGLDCILRAPRRFGKTSLALRLVARPEPGFRGCYVDLEGGESPGDFILAISKALERHSDCAEICMSAWNETETDWKAFGKKLIGSINCRDKKFLLILDELSFLADNIFEKGGGKDTLLDLLTWFEELRKTKPQGLCFMVSGSEHLPSYLESRGIQNTLSALKPIHLKAFSPEKAHEFIFLAMARQCVSISPSECQLILDLMGNPIPYFLQLFLDALIKKCLSGVELNLEEIEKVYLEELLGAENKRYFESIKRQLDYYSRRDSSFGNAAKSVLDRLASGESVEKLTLETLWNETTKKPGTFESMFAIMRDDFYLAEENGMVSLDSKLLKDWWNRHMHR